MTDIPVNRKSDWCISPSVHNIYGMLSQRWVNVCDVGQAFRQRRLFLSHGLFSLCQTGTYVSKSLANCSFHCQPVSGKHDTLTQCWLNVGPASQTMVQHWTIIGSVYRVYWAWCNQSTIKNSNKRHFQSHRSKWSYVSTGSEVHRNPSSRCFLNRSGWLTWQIYAIRAFLH